MASSAVALPLPILLSSSKAYRPVIAVDLPSLSLKLFRLPSSWWGVISNFSKRYLSSCVPEVPTNALGTLFFPTPSSLRVMLIGSNWFEFSRMVDPPTTPLDSLRSPIRSLSSNSPLCFDNFSFRRSISFRCFLFKSSISSSSKRR